MRAIGGALAAGRWLARASLVALLLSSCAPPEMPHLPPRAGRRPSMRVPPPPSLAQVWSRCVAGARRVIASGSVDCGALYEVPYWVPRGVSREEGARCSYEAWLGGKPFFARDAYGSHFPEPYLLAGHADGSLSYVPCDWFSITVGPEFRCAAADVVFVSGFPSCDSATAPHPFGQRPRREMRRSDRRPF